jgi:hypothetical protein
VAPQQVTYAHVCSRMLTYAEVWRRSRGSAAGRFDAWKEKFANARKATCSACVRSRLMPVKRPTNVSKEIY